MIEIIDIIISIGLSPVSPEQCKALEAILPPRPAGYMTNMELDECEETTLHDVNIEDERDR